jgi:hypothetical protein
MKKRIPLLNVWLLTDRRLQAGYRHRYEKGYRAGLRAGCDGLARETQTQGWTRPPAHVSKSPNSSQRTRPSHTRKIQAKRHVSDSPTLEVRAQPAIGGQRRPRNLDHAEGVFETG